MNLLLRAKRLAEFLWRTLQAAVAWVDLLFSRKKPRDTFRKVWSGGDPCATARHAAIFCHFDRQGRIADYVVHYVQELRAAGFRIYFLSNALKHREAEIAKVLPHVCEVIWRRNIGFDFGAYKDGIAYLNARGLAELDGLLLANDSVYGPLFPLRETFERGEALGTDFWGITDSWERRWHLQSYFLYFGRRALESPHFLDFFLRRLPYFHTREGLIRYGEVLLSTFLSMGGLRSRAIFEYNDITARYMRGASGRKSRAYRHRRTFRSDYLTQIFLIGRMVSDNPVNSTHFFWDLLISLRCPFIKRDLLSHNPGHIENIYLWQSQIARHSDYDTALIADHLKLAKRPRHWS